MNKQLTNKGFTIIEVVLVLAIAGLIFLMVFIALPALQAGQRDTARKNDASTVLSAVNTYVSGNRGNFPANNAALIGAPPQSATVDVPAGFSAPGKFVKDVSRNTTAIRVNGTAGAQAVTVGVGQIIVTQRTTCGSTGAKNGTTNPSQALLTGTANQYTVVTYLEGGGGVSYCAQS